MNGRLITMKKIRILYLILSVFFLVIGICIYFLFRNIENMLIFKWVPLVELNIDYLPLKLNTSVFSYVLVYNIPDMLWFLSGILFFRFLWFNNCKTQMKYILCFYVIGAVIEISQLFENIPGTFDKLDLLFMCLGALIEGLIYNVFIKRRCL